VAATDPSPARRVDGRVQRRAQNVDIVVDAMLHLLAAGDPWPSAGDIAARAGLSERSLYRYFADLDALARAAVETQVARADHLFQPLPGGGPLDERIARLVAHRVMLHDEVGAIVHAAGLRATLHDAVAQGLAHRRRQMRTQLRELFAPELEGDDMLVALEVATGFEALRALRVDRGCSAARTGRILRHTVEALLGHDLVS
jgi:TetR/AcrR family transcriptional regulator, regulator of autoinduction and epiphytic fitness